MAAPNSQSTPIAILGAGLAGLTLARALHNNSIPFTIFESRPSFTELGHGINIGPNFLGTIYAISEEIGGQVEGICSRNPRGKEDVWMQVRLGAGRGMGGNGEGEGEGEVVGELIARGTGNMTCRRDKLLRVLGQGMEGYVEFGKRVVGGEFEQGVVRFEDGGEVRAGVVVACDGIHSVVRREVFGAEFDARYADSGAYRGLLDIKALEEAVGGEIARTSQVFVGPNGYIIMYPIAGGEKVNVGLWHWRRSGGVWEGGRNWVLENQGAAMREQFKGWGKTTQAIMDEIGYSAPFWATHTHTHQPGSMTRGRACLIGDAAHSMPPHQGAGAGQAVEDAHVLAQVLQQLDWSGPVEKKDIEAALTGFESVRLPRSQRVLETSHEALSFWTDLYQTDITRAEMDDWMQRAQSRFGWIWDARLEEQVSHAVKEMQRAQGSD